MRYLETTPRVTLTCRRNRKAASKSGQPQTSDTGTFGHFTKHQCADHSLEPVSHIPSLE